MPRLRLGINVGGTFTDLRVLDEHTAWAVRRLPLPRSHGPAIIEQLDTTTVMSPEQQATVDRWDTLVISCPPRSV